MRKWNERKRGFSAIIHGNNRVDFIYFSLYAGCDGYRHVRLTSAPDTSKLKAADDVRETETLFYQMNEFLEQFATAHNLKCSLYSGGQSSRLCGGRSITIELKKIEDRVDWRIAQFGPLTATEEYKKIKTELVNSVASRFSQIYVSDVFGSQ